MCVCWAAHACAGHRRTQASLFFCWTCGRHASLFKLGHVLHLVSLSAWPTRELSSAHSRGSLCVIGVAEYRTSCKWATFDLEMFQRIFHEEIATTTTRSRCKRTLTVSLTRAARLLLCRSSTDTFCIKHCLNAQIRIRERESLLMNVNQLSSRSETKARAIFFIISI